MTTTDEPTPSSSTLESQIWEIAEKTVPSVRTFPERDARLPMGDSGLGLDSVQVLDIVLAIQDAFQIQVPEEWLAEEEPTVERLAAFVRAQIDSRRQS